MSTQAEKLAAVEAAVTKLAEIETALAGLKAAYAALTPLIVACHEAEIGTETQLHQIVNGFDAAAGQVAAALRDTISAHAICTLAAKKAGCDVVLPASYAISGGVTTYGGGR